MLHHMQSERLLHSRRARRVSVRETTEISAGLEPDGPPYGPRHKGGTRKVLVFVCCHGRGAQTTLGRRASSMRKNKNRLAAKWSTRARCKWKFISISMNLHHRGWRGEQAAARQQRRPPAKRSTGKRTCGGGTDADEEGKSRCRWSDDHKTALYKDKPRLE